MPFTKEVTITGFGVVRRAPWRLAGVFPTKEEAEKEAMTLGPEYEVRFGENRQGTDDFVFSEPGSH